jgi:hypothetical protein
MPGLSDPIKKDDDVETDPIQQTARLLGERLPRA